MREQLGYYKNALILIEGNESLYTGLKSIRCRFKRVSLIRYMTYIVSILSMITYIVATLCYKTTVNSSTSVFLSGVALLIQGTLVGCLVYYLLQRGNTRLDNDILLYVNEFLSSKYTCVADDSVDLVFKDDNCYISYKKSGVMEEQEGVYEEDRCRLEVRESYRLRSDCRLSRSREYVVVSVE